MLEADGYLFGTTANLGYMSGALKHFFDTVYYPSLDHVAGRPYGLWVHGNNDTVGAANAVDKVATGLASDQGRRRARGRRRHRCRGARAGLRTWWHAGRDADGVTEETLTCPV